jgi:leader peptidase (prepilin peptidase) / N-methyltransferase
VLHVQFAGHACLLTIMLAASLIDLAEWEIPDAIAVTGTLVGLAFAVVSPNWQLFTDATMPAAAAKLDFHHLQLASPGVPPSALAAREPLSLLLALACASLWCFAQLPRVWIMRRGFGLAARLFWRVLTRERDLTIRALAIGVVLTIVCSIVWWSGDARWISLLSALVGLTVGSGIVWAIRIVASAVLRQEAMGFGDVTLMAMIGAFLGWQAVLVAFFLSPFFGLIPPLIGLALRRKTQWELPFGPFLCLGAAGVLLWWASIWPRLAEALRVFNVFGAGFTFAVLGGAFVVLVALLFGVRALRRAFA